MLERENATGCCMRKSTLECRGASELELTLRVPEVTVQLVSEKGNQGAGQGSCSDGETGGQSGDGALSGSELQNTGCGAAGTAHARAYARRRCRLDLLFAFFAHDT